MKTLYNSEIITAKHVLTELKVRSVLKKPIFFPFQIVICCVLFLCFYLTSNGQTASVATDKVAYFPGESILISGAVWQPGENVRIIVSKLNNVADSDTLFLTADAQGEILSADYSAEESTEYTVYEVTASGIESQAAATTSFSNKLGLSQCHNGGIGETPISPIIWVNGNANAQNSHYIEGNSIPYRVIMDGATAGVHTVRIKWDIKHGDKHAIDFITSYKRSVAFGGIAEIVDPRSDLPEGVFADPTTFAIPTPAEAIVINGKPQPSTSFLGLPAADRMMSAFNATILNIVYLYEGDINSDNSTTEIEITYEVDEGAEFIMFAWSGHIASRLDWGAGSSASNINGSPYHTAMGISDFINGAQDRSLKADAVQFFPTCSISPLDDNCVGDTISVTATTDAPSPQFTWSATNGAIIIGSGATVQVVCPSGPYSVTVSIVDFFEGQIISEVTECSADGGILDNPVVAAGIDQAQCLAIDGRDFSVTGSVSFGEFEWVVVSGDCVIETPNALTTNVHLNSNSAVIRIQAIGACEDQQDDLALLVNIEPDVEISTGDNPDCQDSTGSYSVAEAEGYSYQWSITGNAHIDGASNGSSVNVVAEDLCGFEYELHVAVTDANGCVGYDSLTVAASDSVAPVITEGPSGDQSLTCPEVPEFVAPSASDNCDIDPTIHQLDDVIVPGNCEGTYSITRKWYFSDDCGNNSDTVSYTIDVIDDVAPIITEGPGDDETISCPAEPEFDAPSASDNCDGSPAIHQLDDVIVPGDCPAEYSVTRRWYFTDACENHSDTVSQTINVIDNVAPEISQQPGGDQSLTCPEVPEFIAPAATDNCDAEPTIHQLDDVTVPGDCAGTYTVTRRWYFSDDCGNNSDTVSYSITVSDDVAPNITSGPGQEETISCPAEPEFDAPSAEDNCDAEPTIHQLDDIVVEGNCAGTYSVTRRWYFTDDCENSSDTVSQTINVIDNTPPQISVQPSGEATITCPSVPQFEAPSATDNCDAAPTIHQLDDVVTPGDCANESSVTRSWYFSDACGNNSDTVSYTVNIIDDQEPIIVQAPGADSTIHCPAEPEFQDPVGEDNCDGSPVLHQLDDERVDGECEAEYSLTRSWYFTDACGNISDTVSQTITVIDDEIPLLSEPEDLVIDCDEEPIFTAPTPSDNCSEVVVTAEGPDTTFVNGEMVLTMTWTASDACGNDAVSVDQAITIHNCPDVFCSLTQGFYGNARGTACATGERGRALMIRLLSDFGPMVIGGGGKTLTLTSDKVDCLIGDLPAGGTASILPNGNASYNGSCALPTGYIGGNGRFRNVLLGQVITLGFNLRLDAELGGLQLEGSQMTTYGSEPGLDGLCGTEDDTMNVEDVLIKYIPQSVLDALDAQYAGDRSIGNLFLLANRMLGGEVIQGVSLSQINQAISAMNEGFDHCRFLGGFLSARDTDVEANEIVEGKEMNYKVFPNPFSENTTIEFVVSETMNVTIELFAANGDHVATLFNDMAEGQRQYQVILNGSLLENGVYFCRIITENEVLESRIVLNR